MSAHKLIARNKALRLGSVGLAFGVASWMLLPGAADAQPAYDGHKQLLVSPRVEVDATPSPRSNSNTTYLSETVSGGLRVQPMVNLNDVSNSNPMPEAIVSPLPAGTNVIGSVNVNALPSLAAGSQVIGGVFQSGPWAVTVSGGIQVGTVSAIQSGAWEFSLVSSIPSGANTIGAVMQAGAPWDMNLTNATLPPLGAGSNVIGAVTQNGPWVVAISGSTGGGIGVSGTVSALQSGGWNVGVLGPLPSGTNSLGAVTQGGAWTVGVSALPALPAGANSIGSVGQTGTWNVGVTALPALPAGANTIGAVTQAGAPWTVNVASGAFTGIVASTQSGAWTVGVNALPSLPTGTNHIGSVTQSGAWTVGVSGSVPLASGSATIGAVNQAGTWNVGVSSLPALPAGANTIGAVNQAGAPWSFLGAVTQSGAWNVGVSGNVALASGANTIGAVNQAGAPWSVNVNTLPALPAGSNSIGSVGQTGSWSVGVTSLPALAAGTNNIGSVTQSGAWATAISGSVLSNAVQSGAWNVGVNSLPALPTGSNSIGSVGQTGTWSVGVTSLPSLAAGTNNIGSVTQSGTWTVVVSGSTVATSVMQSGAWNVGVLSLPALPSGSNTIGNVGITSLPSLAAGSNNIGSVTQSGAWSTAVSSLPSLPSGSALIGGVTPYVSGAAISSSNPMPAQDNTVAALLAGSTGTPCASPTTSGCSLSQILAGSWNANLQEPTVKIDPSNLPMPITPPGISTVQDGTVTSSGAIVLLNTPPYMTGTHVFKQVGSGTTVVAFQQSPDNGISDWIPLTCFEIDGNNAGVPVTGVSLATAFQSFNCHARMPYQRAFVTTYTSGTIEDYAFASITPPMNDGANVGMGVYNNQNNIPGLSQGGELPTQLDPAGSQFVNGTGRVNTYKATTTFFTPATGATDVFTIYGTSSLPVHIKNITMQITASGAGYVPVSLYRRTSQTSGGTSVSVSAIKMGMATPNAGATVTYFTANPSVGNGTHPFATVLVPYTTTTSYNAPVTLAQFGNDATQDYQSTLIGNELAINLGGATLPSGAQIAINITWTEESD